MRKKTQKIIIGILAVLLAGAAIGVLASPNLRATIFGTAAQLPPTATQTPTGEEVPPTDTPPPPPPPPPTSSYRHPTAADRHTRSTSTTPSPH
jgi:hypothetical protein